MAAVEDEKEWPFLYSFNSDGKLTINSITFDSIDRLKFNELERQYKTRPLLLLDILSVEEQKYHDERMHRLLEAWIKDKNTSIKINSISPIKTNGYLLSMYKRDYVMLSNFKLFFKQFLKEYTYYFTLQNCSMYEKRDGENVPLFVTNSGQVTELRFNIAVSNVKFRIFYCKNN